MAFSMAGMIIGPDFVQAIEAKRTFKGVAITKAFAVSLAASTDLAHAIQQALSGAGITAKRIGVSVSAQEVLVRSFSLPLLPRGEWLAAVQSEARKHIPFKPEGLTWDFHATEDRANRQLNVAFMGVETKAFLRITEALGEVGVSPAFIEPQSVSLSRVPFQESKIDQDEFVAIVDLSAAFAHIVIAKQQAPYFVRDVNFSLAQRSSDTAPTADVGEASDQSAAAVSAAVGGEGASEWGSAPDRRAEVLLSELRLSVDFFTREHPAAVVKRVVLLGDDAAIASWRVWLSRQLGLAIEGGAVPVVPVSGAGTLRMPASALGLAIRSLRSVPVHPDFLHPTVATAKQSKEEDAAVSPKAIFARFQWQQLVKPAVAQVILAMVILAGLKLMGVQEIAQQRQALEAARRAPAELPAALQQQTKAQLSALEKQRAGRLAFLTQLKQGRPVITEKLSILARALPDGVWFDGVSFSDHMDAAGPQRRQVKLTVAGACFLPETHNEVEVISRFAAALKSDAAFTRHLSQVALKGIAEAEDSNRLAHYQTFRLECGSGRAL